MENLIREIEAAGAMFLLVDGEELELSAPAGVINPGILAQLRKNKTGILRILVGRAEAGIRQRSPPNKELEGAKIDRTYEAGPKDMRRSKRWRAAHHVALAWLQAYRVELKAAGWTGRELYRRNKSRGLLWGSIWNRPNLQISITPDGIVEFWFPEQGRMIRQTARPLMMKRPIGGHRIL